MLICSSMKERQVIYVKYSPSLSAFFLTLILFCWIRSKSLLPNVSKSMETQSVWSLKPWLPSSFEKIALCKDHRGRDKIMQLKHLRPKSQESEKRTGSIALPLHWRIKLPIQIHNIQNKSTSWFFLQSPCLPEDCSLHTKKDVTHSYVVCKGTSAPHDGKSGRNAIYTVWVF
jgi:hypothetical protein